MKTDLKQSLNRAVDQLPHPSFRDIADQPVIKLEVMDRIAVQEENVHRKYSKQFYRYAVPVFLCLLLLLPGFGYVRSNLLVDGIIDLDVNPSIEITINRRDRVLQVKGLNEEAREVLAGTDYRTWDVRDAVGDLVLRLNDRQYISRDQRTVLLSVESKSPEKTERIKKELSASIEAALAGTEIQPLVVRQSRPKDHGLQKKANEYHISSGKMRLVEEAARKAPDRDERELAGSAVDELYRLLRNGGGGRPDWLETDRDLDDDREGDWDDQDQDEDDGRDGDDDGQDRDKEAAGGTMRTGTTRTGTTTAIPEATAVITPGTMTARTGIPTAILKRKAPAKRRERIPGKIPTVLAAENTIPTAMTAMRMMIMTTIKPMIKTAKVL